MKAMILAAGLGTRLRPLTDERPKALVEVAGCTLLEIALRRLKEFGITEVVVNVHHFGEMVARYLRAHDFGVRIDISQEEELLDTGGGLKRAERLLAGGDEPFVLHNVDVISTIDLGAMVRAHRERGALATLAVRKRESSRHLLFDGQGELCGRHSRGAEAEMARAADGVEALGFTGVHVISPRIFGKLSEEGAFPIIPAYLRMAGEGERICGFRCDAFQWRDVGTLKSLELAGREMEERAQHFQ